MPLNVYLAVRAHAELLFQARQVALYHPMDASLYGFRPLVLGNQAFERLPLLRPAAAKRFRFILRWREPSLSLLTNTNLVRLLEELILFLSFFKGG